MTSLYICYFGLRQPLVQTQVLPYLRGLSRTGVRVLLLTFEPEPRKRWNAATIAEWRERLRLAGIDWFMTTYHSRPSLPATLYDIVAGSLRVARLVRNHRVDLLHARSHVGAMIGALARILTGSKLVFDIRGLLADEYADAGRWSSDGLAYRLTKGAERSLVRSADGCVVLTERVRDVLFADERTMPVEVIPCCFDGHRFRYTSAARDRLRREMGVNDRTVIVHAGSLGGLYLTRELAELFGAARALDSGAFPVVLTQSDPEAIRHELIRVGFAAADFHIAYVDPETLPDYLSAGDIGVCLLKPAYSKIASSPTKVAEYLASGLAVISSRGIGDLDLQLERERVGVLLDGFDGDSFRKAVLRAQRLRLEPGFRERCHEVARSLFDLESVGVAGYKRLYDAVMRRR